MTGDRKFGLQKVTLADFPGEVAATIFTTGCNMRCPYCHNADLAVGKIPAAFITYSEIITYLKKRQNVLGGVAITGGEPLMVDEIEQIIDDIHKLGLKVKLDTNGSFPEKLKKIKPDFIAMDIKTSPSKYSKVGFSTENGENTIEKSIKQIMNSNIPYEFRTTVVPGIVDKEDIKNIAKLISKAKRYTLVRFNPIKTLNPEYKKIVPYSKEEMFEFAQICKKEGINPLIRGF